MCLHQNGLTQMALWAVWVAGPQTNSQTSNVAGVSTWCLVLPSTYIWYLGRYQLWVYMRLISDVVPGTKIASAQTVSARYVCDWDLGIQGFQGP